MDLDLIIAYGIVLIVSIFIIGFGFLLHSLRTRSTKASDYFNKLAETKADNDEKPDNGLTNEIENYEEKTVDVDRETARRKQTVQYAMILDMHINNKHRKKDINKDSEDEKDELEDYLSIKDMGTILNIKLEEISLYLIDEGLIERDQDTLVLTDKGIDMGGKYVSHEDVTWIEFPKDILKKLENVTTLETKTKKNKSSKDENIWFMIIVIALIYFFFFR